MIGASSSSRTRTSDDDFNDHIIETPVVKASKRLRVRAAVPWSGRSGEHSMDYVCFDCRGSGFDPITATANAAMVRASSRHIRRTPIARHVFLPSSANTFAQSALEKRHNTTAGTSFRAARFRYAETSRVPLSQGGTAPPFARFRGQFTPPKSRSRGFASTPAGILPAGVRTVLPRCSGCGPSPFVRRKARALARLTST